MEFTISMLKEGGYAVYRANGGNRFNEVLPIFAATTIEEALKFIKKQMAEKTNANH